jgi:hypothetical protein
MDARDLVNANTAVRFCKFGVHPFPARIKGTNRSSPVRSNTCQQTEKAAFFKFDSPLPVLQNIRQMQSVSPWTDAGQTPP